MTRTEALEQLLREVGIVQRFLDARMNATLPTKLPRGQFDILNHLVHSGRADETPSDLARAFMVSRPAMTQALQRLEEKGFVTLEPTANDARARHVRLTAAGRRAHSGAVLAVSEDMERIAKRFRRADIAELLYSLRRFREGVERTVLPLDEAAE